MTCTVVATTNHVSAGSVKTYTINFDSADIRNQTLDQIEGELNNKSVEDLDLKILFFSGRKALRINASAILGIKTQYENTSDEVKNKINNLQQQGVQFIICESSTKKKQTTITSNITPNNSSRHSIKVQSKLDHLQSQGYSCITP